MCANDSRFLKRVNRRPSNRSTDTAPIRSSTGGGKINHSRRIALLT